jgi:tRNA pseudouridine synthase 10
MNRSNRPPAAKVFVEGRYRKLSRDLPQTVFFCPDCKGHPRRRKDCARCEGFGKLTRDSVQELIGWVLGAAFKTRKHKFHGAGREDVNVRMLGAGRPFVMEFHNPAQPGIDLAAAEAEINRRNAGRLEVLGLHWTEKARVRAVKESQHAKEYRAAIQVERDPDPAAYQGRLHQRIPIAQRTPARVAHRRADLERERWLEIVALEKVAPGRFDVQLRTQHGTYVKEAISGEGGSTTPSLGDILGTPCECLELDVLEILDQEGRGLGYPVAPVAAPDPGPGAILGG